MAENNRRRFLRNRFEISGVGRRIFRNRTSSRSQKRLADARLLLLAMVAFSLPVVCSAVGPTTRSVADANQKARPKLPAVKVDPKVESAAHQLVQNHLTELQEYLKRLRSNDPRQYEKAIAALGRSAKKLEASKARDERLFEIELETLKSQNAVDLLTAKLKVRDNDADRKKLRKAVERLKRSQIARARYDVDSLQARLERTAKQLESARDRLKTKQQELDEQPEKAYVSFLRKAGRQPSSDNSDPPSEEKKTPVRKKRTN